ncbi:DODA-type extradiol aromatic ring-opening family dioxygenase [Polycyclovorans algicola]|uniref:DODA-type extradiol aromatic ring-opening family dioxygenase n=1 Tax=Polycyclovorans algicola TaxID=616992 RepID=UPI0004A6B06E|nr:class III extradiol ring-cleavage dioxygenase [Polycyclovorans algicola]
MAIQTLFLSHGGGPMPLLGDPGHVEMVACLRQIAEKIPRPDAIVVVSAHWEARLPTITAHAHPSLIYDYHGFPAESYRVKYPCPGAPALAGELQSLLRHRGVDAALDADRGLDHGVFVPLKIMYPEADIPCIQLSLCSDLDPVHHLAMGAALSPLRRQKVLLIGSGFSFHNMKAFFASDTVESAEANRAFERWLHETCLSPELSEAARAQRLTQWADAPGARFCHPREEHLLPLHVCYGAAQRPAAEVFSLNILGKAASMVVW